jgi:hypothetical protein
MKSCAKCKESKPVESFSKDKQKTDGRDNYCRPCRAEIQRTWRDRDREHYRARARISNMNNKEKVNARQRAAYAKNPERWRDYNLKAHYGISAAEYDAMFEAQQGRCAICRKTSKRKLDVDHDHSTGKVRALLCWQHNTGLGSFNEDPDLLRRAIEYVEYHRSING